MNMIQTTKTYKTADNATAALTKTLARIGLTANDVRWLIAVAPDGRFAPVVMFDNRRPELVGLAHVNVTVIG